MSRIERINPTAQAAATVARGADVVEAVSLGGVYTVTCYAADGSVRWTDTVRNLVTTAGKNDLLDKYLAGATYTAAWFLGLIDSAGWSAVNVADTAASHSGWTESTAYSNSTRPAPSWGAAAAGSKASTATAFNINGTATIKGTFLISNSTKGGTTGILYSAGLFTGGDRAVVNGDRLDVTYTASA